MLVFLVLCFPIFVFMKRILSDHFKFLVKKDTLIKDRIIANKQFVRKFHNDKLLLNLNKENAAELFCKFKGVPKDHYVMTSSVLLEDIKIIAHATHIYHNNYKIKIVGNPSENLGIVWNQLDLNNVDSIINLKNNVYYNHLQNHRLKSESNLVASSCEKINLLICNNFLSKLDSSKFEIISNIEDLIYIEIPINNLTPILKFDYNPYKTLEDFNFIKSSNKDYISFVIYADSKYKNISNLICSEALNEDVKFMINNLDDLDKLEKKDWMNILDQESVIHSEICDAINSSSYYD